MHYEDDVYIIVVLYTCKKVIRKIVNVLSLDFREATGTVENFDTWNMAVYCLGHVKKGIEGWKNAPPPALVCKLSNFSSKSIKSRIVLDI